MLRVVVLVLSLVWAQPFFAKILYPDFDASMFRQGLDLEKDFPDFDAINKEVWEPRDHGRVGFFRKLYYENISKAKRGKKTLRIPKIIHQIWMGGSVPESYRSWMEAWASLEGWEYKLWTEKEIEKLSLYNQALFDESTNYGEKADILRLELLHQFGGLYVDTDVECVSADIFEELHQSFDFYIGFEPLEHGFVYKFNMFKVCNAIIGSAPSHPLMQDLVVNLKANYRAYQECCNAVQRTGPSYLTRMICEHEDAKAHRKRNMYLPCTFFYTVSEPEMRQLYKEKKDVPFHPETAACHYWSGSWWRGNPDNVVEDPYTTGGGI